MEINIKNVNESSLTREKSLNEFLGFYVDQNANNFMFFSGQTMKVKFGRSKITSAGKKNIRANQVVSDFKLKETTVKKISEIVISSETLHLDLKKGQQSAKYMFTFHEKKYLFEANVIIASAGYALVLSVI